MKQLREYKHLGNPPGQESGGKYASNWGLPGNVQRPISLDHYSTQARKGIQNLQAKGWQTQNPEHRHPVLVKFMSKFLKKYSTPYFAKVLIRRKQDNDIFAKIWGKFRW